MVKKDSEKTPAELEIDQIANLKLMAAIRQRNLAISEIPEEVRKLIDGELFCIASIECHPELSKLDKIRQNRRHYTAIKVLSVDFWKQIVGV